MTGAGGSAAAAPGWVTARTGVRLQLLGSPGAGPAPVGLALRHNPRRAHLLVSGVLGKHVPVAGRRVLDVGERLGRRVADVLAPGQQAGPVVVGFAETATGLGHAVAAGIAAAGAAGGSAGAALPTYLHTTRRPAPAGARVARFAEEHSHAVDQTLAVVDDAALAAPAPLVLVDDEISTGRTAVNAIRALHAAWPRDTYVLASLLDTRSPEQVAGVADAVAALGATLTSVALWTGRVHLPDDVLARAAAVARDCPPPAAPPAGGGSAPAALTTWVLELPAGVPVTAAAGWSAADEAALRAAADCAAERLRPLLVGRAHVLGDEEFLYAGQLVAAALGGAVTTSSTTRSPALVVDEPGYPLRTVLRAEATDGSGRPVVAYNVPASADPLSPGAAPGFDTTLLVTDADLGRPEVARGLLARLTEVTRHAVHAVQVAPGRASGPVLRRGATA